jgi:hypothetical protein
MRPPRPPCPAPQVYVLGGATHAANRVVEELRHLREHHGGLVLMLDSDVAGRQARNQLEAALPGCLHAFVPAPLATAVDATGCAVVAGRRLRRAKPACGAAENACLHVMDWRVEGCLGSCRFCVGRRTKRHGVYNYTSFFFGWQLCARQE